MSDNIEVFIRGIGFTPVSEHWGKSLKSLALDAARKTIEDSNYLKPDFIIVSSSLASSLQSQEYISNLIAENLGFREIPSIRIDSGEASGIAALEVAWLMVRSGKYKNVLVVGVEKPSDRLPQDFIAALSSMLDRDYFYYNGITHASLFALLYKKYLKEYSLKQEDVAEFASHDHRMALNVDHAQYKFPLSVEKILASPLVSDPIRLFESFPVSDGAAAVMVSSEIDSDEKDFSVKIDSITSTSDVNLLYRDNILNFNSLRLAFEAMRKQTKITKKEINFIEIHDSYTIAAPLILESLGLVEKGEACKMLKEGQFEKDASLPLNLGGGLKARGHPIGATGLYQVCEAVLQLRGKAGNQLSKAELGLVQSMSNVADQSFLVLLRRFK